MEIIKSVPPISDVGTKLIETVFISITVIVVSHWSPTEVENLVELTLDVDLKVIFVFQPEI